MNFLRKYVFIIFKGIVNKFIFLFKKRKLDDKLKEQKREAEKNVKNSKDKYANFLSEYEDFIRHRDTEL